MTIYRSDGSTISIASGSQAVTGLAASTTYKFYPYVADSGGSTGTISFVAVSGGSGTPTIAYPSAGSALAAAGMSLRGNIPFGGFQAATPASGSGGGVGGGITCLHPEMLVGDRIAADLEPGSTIATPAGRAAIEMVSRTPNSKWIVISSGEQDVAKVTPRHLFYRAANGQAVHADEIRLGDLLAAQDDHVEVTGLRMESDLADLVAIEVAEPHLHYGGPAGLLMHNGASKP